MSGRREPQVHELARIMGQTSYIYEAGCAYAIDRETTLLTGDLQPSEEGTIYEQLEARGTPRARAWAAAAFALLTIAGTRW